MRNAPANPGEDGGSEAAERRPEARRWAEAAPPAPRPEEADEVLSAMEARARRVSSRRIRPSYDTNCAKGAKGCRTAHYWQNKLL